MCDNVISIDYETGPITALQYISDQYLIAGVCGNLQVYDINNTNTTKIVHVEYDLLHKQKIHAIRKVSDNDRLMICVFGGKGIQVLQVNIVSGSFHSFTVIGKYKEFSDWIWDVVWVKKDNDYSTIAIATAHNVILHWDWTKHSILNQVNCSEKCILYSAHFIGNTWNNLLLAAGTVFNQIVIWSTTGKVNSQGQQEVIHRLQGHQGVIFSIDYRQENQIIASASDDRSIRLWKLSFGDQSLPCGTQCCITSQPLLTLYGHSARVWSVCLLQNKLVSVGEDSTCCVWSYSGDVICKYKGHKGKSIWSIDINEQINSIVTGGGDNSIRLWKMNDASMASASEILTVLNIPSHLKKSDSDIPRCLTLQNYNNILIMTNSGCLLEFNIIDNSWRLLCHEESFKSYSLMVTSPDEMLSAVGNIEGDIRIFNQDSFSCKRYFNGKVYGLLWIDSQHILTTGPDGNILLLEACVRDKQICVNEKAMFILPVCKQRWVSCALIVNNGQTVICGDRGGTVHNYCINQSKDPLQSFPKIHGKAGVTSVIYNNNKIYTAGRDGQYRIWSLKHNGHLEMLNTHKVYKGLEWIDRLQFSDSQLYVYGFHSTKFVIWSECDNQLFLQIDCGGGHRSWDCKQIDDKMRFVYLKNGDIIVHTSPLQRNQVILKPGLHGREICDIKCIKRVEHGKDLHHLIITASEDTEIIISLLKAEKDKPVFLHPLHILQGHLSSVRTLAINTSQLSADLDKQDYLVFSGGGRAQIDVWKLKVKNKQINSTENEICDPFKVDFEHLSNSFLGEVRNKKGLKPWKNQYINPDPETRILCLTSFCCIDIDTSFPPFLHFVGAACSDGFVRLFCFDEQNNKLLLLDQSEYHNNCVLKIHHFLHKSSLQTQIYLLSGATEGVIAFWDVTETCLDVIHQHGKKSHSEACHRTVDKDDNSELSQNLNIDNNDHLQTSETEKSERNLCYPDKNKSISVRGKPSSDTDAKGTSWQPCFSVKCHQSGINSVDIFYIKDGMYLLATGGDDNCLFLQKLLLTGHSIQTLQSGQEINAHAAQITGVKILSSTRIMTVSVDQRLNLWNVTESSSYLKITNCDSKFINISDISNIHVCSEKNEVYYYVCGVGIVCGNISNLITDHS